MTTKFSIIDFMEKFPADDACLEVLFQKKFSKMKRCPKCGKENPKFYKVENRKCYQCGKCNYHMYPMAGTIMHGSTTSLRKWFIAIFLFAKSKNGVSAKELERVLGVTYKCAHRIGKKIRSVMQEDKILSGVVEIDESMFGGKKPGKRGWGAEGKVLIFGMVERKKLQGRVKTVVVSSRKRKVLMPVIRKNIRKGSTISSDGFKAYRTLSNKGYKHKVSLGATHQNYIEGYWGNFKKSIRGTHSTVSDKYLQTYLNEFQFRYDNRNPDLCIFDMILDRV